MSEENFEHFKLSDEGTRYSHYTELMEMWESGITILENIHQYRTEKETKQLYDLKNCVKLLRKQLENMADYLPWSTRDAIESAYTKENSEDQASRPE